MGVNLDVGLRRLVLTVAGWSLEHEPEVDVWRLKKPDGAFYEILEDIEGYGTHKVSAWLSADSAWQNAPAVESSIDACVEHLTLSDGLYWTLDGPVFGAGQGGDCLAAIQDINTMMERVEVNNPALPDEMLKAIKFNKPVAEATGETLPIAICNAFLAWKGQVER